MSRMVIVSLLMCITVSGCGFRPVGESGSDAGDVSAETFEKIVLSRVTEIEKNLNCRIGLSFRDADLPIELKYRADERFHAASTMKTPVMIEVFRQAELGNFALEDKTVVDPVCQSFLENSTFECDAKEYLTSMLHKTLTLRKITEQMIVVSDNLATNMLIERCGYRNINSTLRELGAHRGYVLRGVQDEPAYLAGLSNRMTPHDLMVLFEAIDTDKAASSESCAEMREILLRQEYNNMIPARLPDNVRVAHKTGAISGVRHDSGIVYTTFGTWYLAIMTDGLDNGDEGVEAVAEISKLIYDERRKLSR